MLLLERLSQVKGGWIISWWNKSKRKGKTFKQWKISPDCTRYRDIYKWHRNTVSNLIKIKRDRYFRQFIELLKNPKEIWNN